MEVHMLLSRKGFLRGTLVSRSMVWYGLNGKQPKASYLPWEVVGLIYLPHVWIGLSDTLCRLKYYWAKAVQ